MSISSVSPPVSSPSVLSSSSSPPLLSGYLKKLSPDNFVSPWQRRWFVLTSDSLSYYKERKYYHASKPPAGLIRVDLIRKLEFPSDPLCFHVLVVGGRRFELLADVLDQAKLWVSTLEKVLRDRPQRVKDEIARIDDDKVKEEYWKMPERGSRIQEGGSMSGRSRADTRTSDLAIAVSNQSVSAELSAEAEEESEREAQRRAALNAILQVQGVGKTDDAGASEVGDSDDEDGSDSQQRSEIDNSADLTELYCGFLLKLSPSGPIPVWQRRFFSLNRQSMSYAKGPSTPLSGQIAIIEIRELRYDRRPGNCAFELVTKDLRVYKLKGEDEQTAKVWIAHIQAAAEGRLGTLFPEIETKSGEEKRKEKREQESKQVEIWKMKRESEIELESKENKQNKEQTEKKQKSQEKQEKQKEKEKEKANQTEKAATKESKAAEPKEKKSQKEAKKQITLRDYLLHQHSVLSLFFVRQKSNLPRYARFFLFAFDLILNLVLVYAFLASGSTLSGAGQVALIVLLLIMAQLILSFWLTEFCFHEEDSPVANRIRFLATLVFLMGGAIALVVVLFQYLPEDSATAAAIRFAVATPLFWIAEAFALALIFRFATSALCCCCRFCIKVDQHQKLEEETANKV